jgi:hypothetical protein
MKYHLGVRMFHVIYNKLRSVKYIQNKFLGGVGVIMTSDFYQAPPYERELDLSKYQR